VAPIASMMPTCSNLYTVASTSMDMWTFTYKISQQAHGPIHLVTGGIAGTPKLLEFAKDLGVEDSGASHDHVWSKLGAFFLMVARAAYRYDLLDLPASGSCSIDAATGQPVSSVAGGSCTWSCDAKKVMESAIYTNVFELYEFTGSFSDENLFKLVDYFCTGQAAFGDHATSSAAADPSFFPVHGTVERYMDMMRLSGALTVGSWPARDQCLFSTNVHPFKVKCAGHYGDDALLFGSVRGEAMTNEGYLKYLDPHTGEKPYVYDNFEFAHCVEAGYTIPT